MKKFKFNASDATPQTVLAVEPIPVPAKESPKRSYRDDQYDFSPSITSFVNEGEWIRKEMEGLISWQKYMGADSGSPKWGPLQQTHATQRIEYLRKALSDLRAAIVAKNYNADSIIADIFGDTHHRQYSAEITQQARAELGI